MPEPSSIPIGYAAYGPVRDWCGHIHLTITSAERCHRADQRVCRRQGGYSDRSVYAVAADGYLHYVGEWGECEEWLPHPAGRNLGGVRVR